MEATDASPMEIDGYANTRLHNALVPDSPDLHEIRDLLSAHPEALKVKNQLGRVPLHYLLDRSEPRVSKDALKMVINVFPEGVDVPDLLGLIPNFTIYFSITLTFFLLRRRNSLRPFHQVGALERDTKDTQEAKCV